MALLEAGASYCALIGNFLTFELKKDNELKIVGRGRGRGLFSPYRFRQMKCNELVLA